MSASGMSEDQALDPSTII